MIRRRAGSLLVAIAAVAAVAVPVITLPRLPHVTVWPVLLGLIPWMIGKYILCPLRWHALSESGKGQRWHIRNYAEAELLGLLTPGHIGADLWRIKRLTGVGMRAASAGAEIALDRTVGALGLVLFVSVAGTALPLSMALGALALASTALLIFLLVRRLRPDLMPQRSLPRPRLLARGLVLSVAYQLSICGLLIGTLSATGHALSPLAVVGAFGASQLAGAVPGVNGASPRDGALVLGLVALGIPWVAAIGAVSLKAAVAWLPALTLGGTSILAARWAAKRVRAAADSSVAATA